MGKLRILLVCCCLAASAHAAGPTTQAVNTPAQALSNLAARTLDLHTATGDVGSIAIPSYVTLYQITAVKIWGCSATPVLASVSLWTGASGTGTNLMAATTITGATSSAVVLPGTILTTNSLTASSVFVNLGVANAATLTCSFKIEISDLT